MQLSEVVLLLLAVAVLPLLVAIGRKTDVIVSNVWFSAGYAAMLVSYTLTIVEGVGGEVGWRCNVGEHAALLVAGVAFALAARRLRGSVAATHGSDREPGPRSRHARLRGFLTRAHRHDPDSGV